MDWLAHPHHPSNHLWYHTTTLPVIFYLSAAINSHQPYFSLWQWIMQNENTQAVCYVTRTRVTHPRKAWFSSGYLVSYQNRQRYECLVFCQWWYSVVEWYKVGFFPQYAWVFICVAPQCCWILRSTSSINYTFYNVLCCLSEVCKRSQGQEKKNTVAMWGQNMYVLNLI